MPLSDEQFAAYANENGGGSIGFFNREPVTGRGFMTAVSGSESRDNEGQPTTASQVADFRETRAGAASNVENPVHGIWGGIHDVSVKAETPNKARAIGQPTGEEASYGLPHTPVNRKGATVGPHGGDVLLHTGDLGKNDVDPNFRPGALDMNGGKGSFTKNEYQNKEWNKKAPSGQTYGDVLRMINKNRAMRIREGK